MRRRRELVERIAADIDSFHNPRAVRYRRGRHSPEGYFLDPFDYPLLYRVLLRPLRPGGNGAERDGSDPDAPPNRRYVEGQRLYLSRCDPQRRATVIVDNTDLAAPFMVRDHA